MRLDPGQIEVVTDEMAAVLRRKTGAERLAILDRLFTFATQLLQSRLRADHPDWSDQQIAAAAAERLTGDAH